MMGSVGERRAKVLVMHALRPTSRQTTIDHLESFRVHLPDADVQYMHFQQSPPAEAAPDVFVINYDFLNYRFSPLWPFIRNRHRDIARRSGKVVAIAQDDFWANKLLDNWCVDWQVDRILTPIDNDLHVLYPRSFGSTEILTCLTGYVKSGRPPVTRPLSQRQIDLGQRVRDMPPHLGRLAQAKADQANAVAASARAAGFVVDVSTNVADSFIGKAWFDFLTSCRFTVGMKGGASLNDPYGLIYTRVHAYLARNPDSTFDDIERKCFPGKDMHHRFTAISPRLFESALAGTCQILQRDDYLGVLTPWRDYLPLEGDMSNMDEVIEAMRDLERCQEIVSRAREALVESGEFDYSKLVQLAVGGLMNQRNDDLAEWEELRAYLDRSSKGFRTHGAEFHDASVSLIMEDLLLKRRIRDVHHLQMSRHRPETTAILECMTEGWETEWFEAMLNEMRSDSLAVRAPWVWRPACFPADASAA
jgi:hypothetical protein